MRRPIQPSMEELCANARRVVVLEGIVDTTNVGAIFRSAAALGMDAVLLTPACCDPLCRRAARVSMGTVFQIPWTRIGAAASDWPGAGLAQLHALGFQTAAMALSEPSVSIDDAVLRRVEKAGYCAGHRRRRSGAGHHCSMRLCGANPHGSWGGFVKCGGGQRSGILAVGCAVKYSCLRCSNRNGEDDPVKKANCMFW